ncbi:integrase, catalytic region, zinc finger, CCHC-type containing protein, partial [Tanacetum coccineum]
VCRLAGRGLRVAVYRSLRTRAIAGKENGVNILKSIDEGPFQMGTFRETPAEGNEGALHLGPERARVYFDLSPEDKERYNVDIQATNILLKGLPKYIYSLINYYTDAKDIWDNVKMLLEGSELTKEDPESQLYDDFEHFRHNKGETIHDYYVRFAKLINDMRNIKMTMSRMQLNSKFVNNMLPEWGRFVTAVKPNRGLRDSNYDQLYAYLKQHEAHANENKMMNQATVQDGRVVVQNVQGRQNRGQAMQIKCYNCNNIGHKARNCIQPKQPQISEYFKDKMLLMQAQENGVALDEEQLLFIAGGQDNVIDEDVDEQLVQDLALNVDNAFQADDCDAFDSDVDEAPTAQTMFMANFSSADLVYDEASPSYDLDILSKVPDHDNYQDAVCEHHEVHEMHDDVQPNYVVDSHDDYMSDSNMIPYDQYVKDNAVPVVQSNVSFVPNDEYMMILNDMHEIRAKFELTEREQKIDEQLRIVIADRNLKDENLKKELYSVKLQLTSTINHNKSMVEEVTSLKKYFKQKKKYLEEFLDMKALKEKVNERLFKQDQSLQTVHMLCKPKPHYHEHNKVALGYKNLLCITHAKQVQPALYNGHEIIKTHYVSAIVHDSEVTLEIAETTRKQMNEKIKDPECVKKKVKIAPHDYSKENYLATFTPQKQLTPEQIFWSNDLLKMKAEALKEQTTASRSIKALTVYPPNTPATHFPRALTKEIKEMKEIFKELEAEVDQNVMNKKCDEIKGKNIPIANDALIADCLSKEVFYIATNSEHTVSIFTEMHDAHTIVQACCLELKAELSKLKDKIQKDDHNGLVKRFSNLEVNHLNLQLKYQHLKENFGNNKSLPAKDAPDLTQFLYDIDVEPIPPRNRNTRKVHLDYLKHLKESVESFRGIVEEAKELLEYVIGTCLKDFNKRDKKHASTTLTRKKQVTFEDQCETSNNNTHNHVEQLNIQKTNVLVIPSTGVDSCTDASGSKPRSNTKKNRISLAKSVNKKKVEEHPRTNKSSAKNTIMLILLLALSVLTFVKKFIRIVRFGNDHFGAIMGYGDYVIGDSVISKQKLVLRTPQQMGIVKRRNRTLAEAARTMLIFSKALMFLWAEAVATACYTPNRSLIHTRHNKTPYELVHEMSHDHYFSSLGALCYPINDNEDLGKLQPTTDIGIFVGYAPSRKGYIIYNKRTQRIMETIHAQFDEPSEPMAPVQLSTGPMPSLLTPGQISSWLVPNLVLSSGSCHFSRTPSSTTIDQDAPSPNHSPSSSTLQSLSSHQGVASGSTIIEDNPFDHDDNDPFVNVFALEPSSEASSSGDASSAQSTHVTQPHHHLGKWSKDHPLDNVIGNPSPPISTRKQLATDALWCLYNSVLSKVEPKNFKSIVTKDCWFQAMQDEIHEFDRLKYGN